MSAVLARILAAALCVPFAEVAAAEPSPAPGGGPPTTVAKEEPWLDPIAVNDDTFEREVLKSKLPVLVHFHAEWAGPSRMLRPTVAHIAAAYEGRLKVVRIDVDANPRTTTAYEVTGIPLLVLFQNGTERSRMIGLKAKAEIVREVEKIL